MRLLDLPVFFLDLQTTGSRPENASILEMAMASPNHPTESFLVEQPALAEVPRRIQMITGVSSIDMESAITFPVAMEKLSTFVKMLSPNQKAICIIHFAQFEKPFLEAAFAAIKAEMPFVIMCTHEIAKRLLPNLPTRGIKGLAGYFGYASGEFKRSSTQVQATKVIWENLLKTLEEKNITHLSELEEWLITTPKAKKTKYEYPLPKEKRLNLPNVPGIYRMLNFKGDVLYVGKATSLKSRVNSYFRGQKKRDSRKLEMLAQVLDIRVTPCETPLEAALLETDEIKRLNPPYNISLKVRGRALAFFDRDFISISTSPDDIHFIGPFSHAMVFESMMKFVTFLNTHQENPDTLPDEETFFEAIDPRMIKEGFELFCEMHGLNPHAFTSMRSVIALGILWQRQEQNMKAQEIEESAQEAETELDQEIEEELEEELEETELLLTPLDVAQKFERHFIRIGRSYLRARRINRMLNADIEFHPVNYPARKIAIRNGCVTEMIPKKEISSTWATHSIETYDRMTVLLSELEKIKTQAGLYHIHFL